MCRNRVNLCLTYVSPVEVSPLSAFCSKCVCVCVCVCAAEAVLMKLKPPGVVFITCLCCDVCLTYSHVCTRFCTWHSNCWELSCIACCCSKASLFTFLPTSIAVNTRLKNYHHFYAISIAWVIHCYISSHYCYHYPLQENLCWRSKLANFWRYA